MKFQPRIREFPKDDRIWRLEWHAGVEKNSRIEFDYIVHVILRPFKEAVQRLFESGNEREKAYHLVDDVELKKFSAKVSVGLLPLLKIGSLWKNGEGLPQLAGRDGGGNLKNLEISAKTVRLINPDKLLDGQALIPNHVHLLGKALDSRCLAIERNGDPYGIIIPIWEIIRFYYAQTTGLAKAVFAGDYSYRSESIVDFNELRDGTLYLNLKKKYYDQEAWTIGRILLSKEAEKGAKMVHLSFVKQQDSGATVRHPESCFPFEGKTTLTAKGKSIEHEKDKWRFLVWSIESCSGPFPFEELARDRDNPGPNGSHTGEKGRPVSAPAFDENDPPEIQSEESPNYNINPITTDSPPQGFLAISGKKLKKVRLRERHAAEFGTTSGETVQLTSLGTANGSGTGEPAGSLHLVPESGILRQQAMGSGLHDFELLVDALGQMPGVTAKLRNASKEKLKFLPLTAASRKRQWVYLNPDKRGARRQVLVADIVFKGRFYSLIEFERRENEENAFVIPILWSVANQPISDGVLERILLILARKKGRWIHLKFLLPIGLNVKTLKHTWSNPEQGSKRILSKLFGF